MYVIQLWYLYRFIFAKKLRFIIKNKLMNNGTSKLIKGQLLKKICHWNLPNVNISFLSTVCLFILIANIKGDIFLICCLWGTKVFLNRNFSNLGFINILVISFIMLLFVSYIRKYRCNFLWVGYNILHKSLNCNLYVAMYKVFLCSVYINKTALGRLRTDRKSARWKRYNEPGSQ